ncbi:hypothetical protein ACMGD3_07080 [Lysinibacillus sphaericus]
MDRITENGNNEQHQSEILPIDQMVPKTKHCMRSPTLEWLKKMFIWVMLTFAAMHLKKLANWTWQRPKMAEIVARSVRS